LLVVVVVVVVVVLVVVLVVLVLVLLLLLVLLLVLVHAAVPIVGGCKSVIWWQRVTAERLLVVLRGLDVHVYVVAGARVCNQVVAWYYQFLQEAFWDLRHKPVDPKF